MKWLYIVLLSIIFFLIAVASYPPLKEGIVSALETFGGGAYVGISTWWASITAMPAYQTYHMLIWFAGGFVTFFLIYKVYKAGKIPLLHPSKTVMQQQPIMSQPQTIIVREVPVPTATTSTQLIQGTTIPVPDQSKKAQEATVTA